MLATLYGSSYHLVVGGDARRLALFLLSSWLGFTLGQLGGELLEISWMNIGEVRLFPASLGASLALMTTWFFTRRSPYDEME